MLSLRPPTTKQGNIAGALALLATGGGIGAVLGYRAAPLPPANKMIGAWEGGTLGVLAASAGSFAFGYWMPQWKRFGETAALIGVGGAVVVAALGMAKNAQAAPALPPSGVIPLHSTGTILQPVADGKPLGSRTFNATTADSGSTAQLAVGDLLNITLPSGGASADWFAFTSTGAPASGYQGLSFKQRATKGVTGGLEITYTYQASDILSPAGNVVEIVLQLLPIDSQGNAITGSQASATFALFVAIGPAQ